jgi:hypothetical protein
MLHLAWVILEATFLGILDLACIALFMLCLMAFLHFLDRIL